MAASTKKKSPSWNKGDDHKLLGLFNEHRDNPGASGLDWNIEVTKGALEAIIEKHFPHIPYRNFRTLWIKKANQYNIDQTLHGANNNNDNEDGKCKALQYIMHRRL